jgi:hypothetical protein
MPSLRRALALVIATSAVPLAGAIACREATPGDASVQPASDPATTPSSTNAPVALAASAGSDAKPDAKVEVVTPPEPVGLGPAKLVPLDEKGRQALLAGEADEPIPVETHYVQSNESRHDLFEEYIANKGGAVIGVGSDQAFTLMAMARAELGFMLDIDFRVADLHEMYAVLIPKHEDPRSLVDAWHERNADATKAVLAEAFAGREERERKRILGGFVVARETVYRHLERVIARKRDGKPSTWLSDPDHYAHVRAMYMAGRMRSMPGDLTGAHSMQTVAAACKALGVKVTALYMSNAEEYFKYTPQFVANIEALPIDDEQSMVLRTIYSKKWVHADLWAYQVQPIADFKLRLADRKNGRRSSMLRYAQIDGGLDKDTGVEGLTLIALTKP